MMTISYEYEGALYVNLTNRCDCACVFCLRRNGHKGSIYADNLWLEHEPTRQEALDNLLARDFSQYRGWCSAASESPCTAPTTSCGWWTS